MSSSRQACRLAPSSTHSRVSSRLLHDRLNSPNMCKDAILQALREIGRLQVWKSTMRVSSVGSPRKCNCAAGGNEIPVARVACATVSTQKILFQQIIGCEHDIVPVAEEDASADHVPMLITLPSAMQTIHTFQKHYGKRVWLRS